ncbi:hypothetical protein O4158_10075 [Gordonia amicalis]|uniref:hypothetical protein n=1 Tax=Gordonia amicalis TaxID=89053 RepID=UPI0022B32A2B|nr:hypothetical protein [Gordonia amicalis]MCZ4579423.1 hypothetical protein [Gordonia amicalis]
MTHRHRRRPAAVAMFLLLALVATLTACGDDKRSGVPTGPGTMGTWAKGSDSTGSAGSTAEAHDSAKISYTAWKKNRDKPSYAIVLTSEIKLPSDFDIVKNQPELLDGTITGYSGVHRGLSQLQDRSVTVTVPEFGESSSYSDTDLLIAVIGQDGSVTSATRYPYPAANRPKPFDLANDATAGYARVTAASGSGIVIPAEAAGDKPEKAYVSSVLRDAFDDTVVWAMVRGSSSVYKAQIQKLGE